ncbi:MAG TPA: type II secretion system protein [Vicinamibacteria bacterium]|nr:type II secretion system protein [Vicinamibacteria bacterium]
MTRVGPAEAGFSLVAAAASITIMLVLMGVAMPSWRYVMQNAREEELLFRGTQIVEAIERYQKKHGSAPPVSLEMLVKGKFLRKEYKDPMTQKGEWRFIRPGEAIVQPPGAGEVRPGRPTPTPAATPRSGFGSSSPRGPLGPFIGVASTSTDQSLRVFNGRTTYDQWLFMVGHPRIVGKDIHARTLPGVRVPRDNPQPRR